MIALIIWAILAATGSCFIGAGGKIVSKDTDKGLTLIIIGVFALLCTAFPLLAYGDRPRHAENYKVKTSVEVRILDGKEVERDTIYKFIPKVK